METRRNRRLAALRQTVAATRRRAALARWQEQRERIMAVNPCREAAMSEEHSSPVELAKAILDAFNAHDLDRVMSFFAEDCTLDMPRGADPWGKRFVGKPAVREGLAGRFKGLPDVHYGEDRHWGDRNMVASEWLLTGTKPDGERVRVRGCDHYEFRDGKVVRKDSYWKIVEPQ